MGVQCFFVCQINYVNCVVIDFVFIGWVDVLVCCFDGFVVIMVFVYGIEFVVDWQDEGGGFGDFYDVWCDIDILFMDVFDFGDKGLGINNYVIVDD